MSIIIKEITRKKDLRKWVDFPNTLYKDEPAYVPFLLNDEIKTFTKKTNPAYDFCETKLFLAYLDKLEEGINKDFISLHFSKI